MTQIDPFFVVFDTSTQPQYYSDVHQVLAQPFGSIIRYEYKRYLCKPDAADALDALAAVSVQGPINTLLMYGEKSTFKKGDEDPKEMLRWSDSVFIATRSARIVNAAKVPGAKPDQDKLHFHLEMRGFVDPDTPEIEALVKALEASDSLPFGGHGQHAWVSLLPQSLTAARGKFISDNTLLWPQVVDKMIESGTQFQDDVFWRVTQFSEVQKSSGADKPLKLVKRPNNKSGDPNRWNLDYELFDLKRYSIAIETHSPPGHGRKVRGDASLAVTTTQDAEGLVRLPAAPLSLVPNQSDTTQFSVTTDNILDARYSELTLETQSPDVVGPYPPGSSCKLSIAIRKERWRLIAGGLSAAVVLLASTLAATSYKETPCQPVALIIAGLAGALAFWFLRREIKLGK